MITSPTIRRRGIAPLALAAAVAAATVTVSTHADAQGQGGHAEAGRELYLDSNSGAVTATPPPDGGLLLRPHEVEMLSTSDRGLVVRRSAGGGMSVDLGGRFRHVSTATRTPTGKLKVSCAGPRGEAQAKGQEPAAAARAEAPARPTPGSGVGADR